MAREVFTMRAFREEIDAWKKAAGERGVSKWARNILNRAAGLSGETAVDPPPAVSPETPKPAKFDKGCRNAKSHVTGKLCPFCRGTE